MMSIVLVVLGIFFLIIPMGDYLLYQNQFRSWEPFTDLIFFIIAVIFFAGAFYVAN